MAFEAVLLADRTPVAADGAPVASSQVRLNGQSLYVEFEYTVTGAPTAVEVRAGIDGSIDGVNWHQLVRFPDQSSTSSAKRVARLPAQAAAAEAAVAASALDTASAAAVLSDGALPLMLRAVTKLQTLTGGTSPSVALKVRASAA